MAFDYGKSKVTARNLISKFGVAATFSRVNDTFNPVTGGRTVSTVDTETVNIVSLPVNENSKKTFDQSTFEGLVQSDILLVLAESNTNGFQPAQGDFLEFNSKVWEVVGVTPLDPTGSNPVLFNVGAKLSGHAAVPS